MTRGRSDEPLATPHSQKGQTMAYYFLSLEIPITSHLVVKADSKEEARQIGLAKQEDEFEWYQDPIEMTVSQIDDTHGAAALNIKFGGRGALLPRGVVKVKGERVFHLEVDGKLRHLATILPGGNDR
jgi:hypothetical protein